MEVKICTISDLHGLQDRMKYKVPECDILICSGDYTNRGEKVHVERFLEWLHKQEQATYKVFIEGNHDIHADSKFNMESAGSVWFSEVLKSYKVNDEEYNLRYEDSSVFRLNNNSINLLGLNIWGSPITPDFYPENWAFNKPRGTKIKQVWDSIPVDTDIVITHGPVYGKLDYVPYRGGQFVGCVDLDYKIQEIKPILHICGHIHYSAGIEETKDTIYVNASICNESYEPINEPHLIRLSI